MISWEDYFRQNTLSETRALAKSLDREAAAEGDVLRREIGDKHTDVLALTQRIESLKLLVSRQESDLAAFASAPGKHVPRGAATWTSTGLGENHIADMLAARLLSIIDRSIVQRKYVLAARALYLAQASELSPQKLSAVTAKLDRRLDAWLLRGTQVSQNMLHACMIMRRWSAATFVSEFLAARQAQINSLLSEHNDMIAAFKLIDSTLFIHHQLVSDLCNSRLSQRRITEMPEFAGEDLLLQHLKAHPQAAAIRAFPPECYESPGEPVQNSIFLEFVAEQVQAAASRLFSTSKNVNALTSMLSKFVMQVQNSLSIESGMGRLLDACEAPFSSKFEDYVNQDSRLKAKASPEAIEKWKGHVTELRAEQAQIARISRTAEKVAKAFSKRLTSLEKRASEQLESNCKAAYAEERARILEQPQETLEQARSVVEITTLLDDAYTALGGSVADPPKPQYEKLAKFIVEQWRVQTHPTCHETDVSGILFDLLLVMDAALGDMTWTPALLEAVRPLVLSEIRETAPELVESAEQALSGHASQTGKLGDSSGASTSPSPRPSTSTPARSRLLLRPLVL